MFGLRKNGVRTRRASDIQVAARGRVLLVYEENNGVRFDKKGLCFLHNIFSKKDSYFFTTRIVFLLEERCAHRFCQF